MPNKDYTHICFILDRSGSMESIKDDTIGGFNAFVEEQKKLPGKCTFSLAQFDHEYEMVYDLVPVNDVEPRSGSNYIPRGQTALLDAIGRAVVTEGEKLAKMKDEDRPGLVVLVILTDGFENHSREYSRSRIKEMLEQQQHEYSWKISYLGANQDAITVAGGLGIAAGSSADFAATKGLARNAYLCTGLLAVRARSAASRGLEVKLDYTSEERDKMEGKSK